MPVRVFSSPRICAADLAQHEKDGFDAVWSTMKLTAKSTRDLQSQYSDHDWCVRLNQVKHNVRMSLQHGRDAAPLHQPA
jgi:hypothetical protein